MKKCLFIYNPHTGGGRLRSRLMPILGLFAEAGYDLNVCPTTAPGDARRHAAKKGPFCDLAVCCGGDGTLNEMVDGLLQHERRPLLGYIPGGTANDFASSLLLPKADMLKAADRILHPRKEFSFDVGCLNDRAFNYVAAFGAFTDVSYTTPQAFKNLLGYFAYLLEGIQRLPNLKAFHASIHTGDEEIEGDFLFGMVANSLSVGGISLKNKDKVQLDDGFFELLLVRQPHNLADISGLSGALLTRDYTSPWVVAQRVQRLSVRSDAAIPWTVDGEFGGKYTEADIVVNHKALRICI